MFTLPALPYDYDSLSPVISEETMHFHHDKHHATYVKTLNTLLEESGAAFDTLEAVVAASATQTPKKLFNNAAQAWNHAFFWEAMAPDTQAPTGELEGAIHQAFESHDKLKEAFVAAGVGQFGSGWVWLASDGAGALKVVATHDADNTLIGQPATPLIVCDLWEHAYYLDYQNDRKAYLEAWFDKLPNWAFAGRQLAAAKGAGKAWAYADAAG